MAEIHVSDMLQLTLIEGVRTSRGIVDDLVRQTEMPGAHGRLDTADRIHRDNRLGTRLPQRPEIGAVVHLVRRNSMRMAVASQEQHFAPRVLATQHRRRRRPIGSIQVQRRSNGQTIQLGQAGTADNGVDSHQ
ncbi:hypothetical protein D3C71_1680420 [compost metagenome]